MNQSILFNDDAEWQASEGRIAFSAMLLGARIQCYMSVRYLESLAGESLPRPSDIEQAFETWRFDIESLAELKIEEQDFAEDGAIYLY